MGNQNSSQSSDASDNEYENDNHVDERASSGLSSSGDESENEQEQDSSHSEADVSGYFHDIADLISPSGDEGEGVDYVEMNVDDESDSEFLRKNMKGAVGKGDIDGKVANKDEESDAESITSFRGNVQKEVDVNDDKDHPNTEKEAVASNGVSVEVLRPNAAEVDADVHFDAGDIEGGTIAVTFFRSNQDEIDTNFNNFEEDFSTGDSGVSIMQIGEGVENRPTQAPVPPQNYLAELKKQYPNISKPFLENIIKNGFPVSMLFPKNTTTLNGRDLFEDGSTLDSIKLREQTGKRMKLTFKAGEILSGYGDRIPKN